MSIARILFVTVRVLVFCSFFFWLGVYSALNNTVGFQLYNKFRGDMDLLLSEDWRMAFADNATHFLQPSRRSGAGVTANLRPNDGSLILLSGFLDGANRLRLINRNGDTIADWHVSFTEEFPEPDHLPVRPRSDFNIDTHGALINPDGSVVFNFEYGGSVKKDRCGKTEWRLPRITHHSVEAAERGGYWILETRYLEWDDIDRLFPFTYDGRKSILREDFILHVGEDGTPLREISIPQAMMDQELRPLLTATGFYQMRRPSGRIEVVHSNKVAELSEELAPAFPEFEAGDLLVSLRNYNLLMVIDPETGTIKWHQIGPWERQHDPEFNPDGTISVFNNNLYFLYLSQLKRTLPETPAISNIMKVDPSTGEAQVVYGAAEGQEMLSVIRGKHDPLPGGGYFVTEHEGGRAFETDAQGRIVWEFINRYDDANVAELSEARLLPADYFDVDDWSCG